jgi:hypothetical protein
MPSSPLIQRKVSGPQTALAWNAEPVLRRHLEQWQSQIGEILPSISYFTAPQRHEPFSIKHFPSSPAHPARVYGCFHFRL